MHVLATTSSPTTTTTTTRRPWAIGGRWMVSFVGFPLGGFTAERIAGPVDTLTAALAGGLITGLILGAVQAWSLRGYGPSARAWIAATGLGLMIGLGLGAAAVDYETNLGSLVVQGAICGVAVGVAQAFVLRRYLGRVAFAWPAALGAIWALGWAITTAAGIQVDEQFTVFGSSGAIVVTALTAVLPFAITSRAASAS